MTNELFRLFHIKLIPTSIDCRQTLPDDCATYFDRETRLLEAPMVIRVADQVSYLPPFVAWFLFHQSKIRFCDSERVLFLLLLF